NKDGSISRHNKNSNPITHGLSKHPLYTVYRGIIDRCYYKTHRAYHRYGEVGVIMCKEWRDDFKTFYDWCMNNGWKRGMEIDKDIKYNERFGTKTGKIYSPEYCIIITRKENAQIKSTTVYLDYDNKRKTISEWSKLTGIKYNTIV